MIRGDGSIGLLTYTKYMVMTLDEAVWQDDDRMSGAVCFRGTRLPVSILFDYLKAGRSATEFMAHYPDATPAMVEAIMLAIPTLIQDRFDPGRRTA